MEQEKVRLFRTGPRKMWWKEPQSAGQLEKSFSPEGGWLLPEPHLGRNSLDFIPPIVSVINRKLPRRT